MVRSLVALLLAVLIVSCGGSQKAPVEHPKQPVKAKEEAGATRSKTTETAEKPEPKPTPVKLTLVQQAERDVRSSDADVRAGAATKLLASKDRSANGRILAKLLADKSEDVREVAAEVMGRAGDAAHAGALEKVLKNDPSWLVRKEAEQSLEKLVGKAAAPALLDRLENDDEVRVRQFAASLLGKIGDKAAVKPLATAATDDPNDSVRLAAITGLNRIGDKGGLQAAISGLKDESELVRAESARTVGKLADYGDKPSVRALMGALDPTDHATVLDQVSRSLDRLTGEKIDFPLDGSTKKQNAAIEAWKKWWAKNKGDFGG